MLCSYCLERIGLFKFKNGKLCCENNISKCPAIKDKYRINLIERTRNGNHPTLGKSSWNKGLTKETDSRVLKNSNSISESFKKIPKEKLPGCCNPEYYKTEKFKNQCLKLGGYRKNSGRSKGIYVYDSFGKRTWLQSSYEIICYNILNELKINWIRPEPLIYKKEEKIFKYYPDFFLPDLDLYLDPKNDYLFEKDKEKIKLVLNSNDVKILILTKDKLTKDYILAHSSMVE